MPAHLQPLRREGLLRRVAPFAIAATIGVLTVPMPPGRIDSVASLVAATVLTALIIAAALLAPWHGLPAWSQAVVPLAYIPVVALLRQAEGGGSSGFAILLLLPVFWLALYGTRRQLVVSVVGVTVALTLPILLVGDPLYPPSEWRRVVLWTVVSPVIGLTVQSLVAEVRRHTSEVSRERRRLEAVLENLADGVVACDRDGRVDLVNGAARYLHGLDEEIPPLELWAQQRREANRAGDGGDLPLLRALGGEIVQEEELLIEASDGSSRAVIARAQPIRGADDADRGAVVVMHDITERKEADQLKEEFFALVSHELRTPLTSIIGYVEVLDDEAQDAESAYLLAFVDRNARRLQRLVGDLLFVAQLEAGNLPLEPGRVNLGVAVSEVVGALEHRARRRSIELGLTIDPVPELAGDADRIGQVFDNVIANAIKYTPEGGRVDVRLFDDGDGHAVVEVADTGIGISPEEQARVWERFFRASTANDRLIQGVGLGLSSSRPSSRDTEASSASRARRGWGRPSASSCRSRGTSPRRRRARRRCCRERRERTSAAGARGRGRR